jgi:hypothetical protein
LEIFSELGRGMMASMRASNFCVKVSMDIAAGHLKMPMTRTGF